MFKEQSLLILIFFYNNCTSSLQSADHTILNSKVICVLFGVTYAYHIVSHLFEVERISDEVHAIQKQ